MAYRLEDIKKIILSRLSGRPFEVMELSLLSSGVLIFIDFLVDFFIIHPNRGLIYVLNINLTASSLWNSFLIVLSFVLFGYLFTAYRDSVKETQENVDGYISRTIEALDVLRYNLYSMRLVVHSSQNDMTSTSETLDSMEKGLSSSINLIDSYLEDS